MTGGPIGDAAAKFSEATYPLAAKIDWGNTQQITKHLGVTEVVFVTFLLTVSFFLFFEGVEKKSAFGWSPHGEVVLVFSRGGGFGLRILQEVRLRQKSGSCFFQCGVRVT